jgi:hypothetical protein
MDRDPIRYPGREQVGEKPEREKCVSLDADASCTIKVLRCETPAVAYGADQEEVQA